MAGLNLKVGINVLQATRELRALGNSINKLGVQTAKANSQASGLAKGFGGLAGAVGNLTGLLVQAAGALAVFGAGIAAKEALTFTADFEEGLAEVNTILGKGSVSIARYEHQLLKLSTTSSKTLTDLTKGLYQTISAGIPAVEGSSGAFAVLEASQKAAVAGLTTTENAVNATVSVLNAYGAETIDATDVTDKLFTTVRLGRVRFDELARGIGRVAPIAANAGVELDDILAVMVELTRQGLGPAEAVTGLRNILRSFIKPTQQTRKAIESFNKAQKAAGRQSLELSSDLLRREGLVGALEHLTKVTGGQTDIINQIFPNIRALIPVLAGTGEGFQGIASALVEIQNSAGATADAFAIIDETFNETFAKFLSNLGVLAATASKGIVGGLNKELKSLNEEMGKTSTIESVKESVEGLVSVLGDMVTALEIAIDGIKVFIMAWAAFKIANLIEGFIQLNNLAIALNTNLAGGALASMLGGARGAMLRLGTAASGLMGIFAGAGAAATASVGATAAAVVALGAVIVGAFDFMLDGMAEVGAGIGGLGDLWSDSISVGVKEGGALGAMLGALAASLMTALDLFFRVGGAIMGVVTSLTDLLGLTDISGNFFSVMSSGIFGLTQQLFDMRGEVKRLKRELGKQRKAINEELRALGYADIQEFNRDQADIDAGRKIGLGAGRNQGATRRRSREAQSVEEDVAEDAAQLSATIDDASKGIGKKYKKAFKVARSEAKLFFEEQKQNSKESKKAAQEIAARLERRLSKTTKLNEAERVNVAKQITISIVKSEIATVEREIAFERAKGDKVSAGNIIALEKQQKGLQRQLRLAKLIDTTNAERRVNAKRSAAAFTKLKKKEIDFDKIRFKALERLKEMETRLELESLKTLLKRGEEEQRLLELRLDKNKMLISDLETERDIIKDSLKTTTLIETTFTGAVVGISKAASGLVAEFNKSIGEQIDKIADQEDLLKLIREKVQDLSLQRNDLTAEEDKARIQKERDALAKVEQDLGRANLRLKKFTAENREAARKAGKTADTVIVENIIFGLRGALASLDVAVGDVQADEFTKSVEEQKRVIEKQLRALTKTFVDFNKNITKQFIKQLEEINKAQVEALKRSSEDFKIGISDDDLTARLEARVAKIVEDTGNSQQAVIKGLQSEMEALVTAQGSTVKGSFKPFENLGADVLNLARAVRELNEATRLVDVDDPSSIDRSKKANEDLRNILSVAQSAVAKARDEAAQLTGAEARVRNLEIKRVSGFIKQLTAGDGFLDENKIKAIERAVNSVSTVTEGFAAEQLRYLLDQADVLEERQKILKDFSKEFTDTPERFSSSLAKTIGSLSLDVTSVIDASLTPIVQKTQLLIDNFSDQASLFLGNISGGISESLGDAVDKLDFTGFKVNPDDLGGLGPLGDSIKNSFKGGAIVATGIMVKGFFVFADAFIQGIGKAFQAGALLLTTVLSKTVGAIGQAITSPLTRLFDSLGSALGVLADTPEEEDRRDRKQSLELQRATLAELQRNGASNESIAQEQARLNALLRSQSDPETATERLEKEIERAISAALRIADEIGPLVETFFIKVTEAIPVVIPALADGLVAALDVVTERLPELIQVLTRKLVDALPKIVKAIIRLIPSIVQSLAIAVFEIVRGLPRIISAIFMEAGRQLLKFLSFGLSGLPTPGVGATTGALFGSAAGIIGGALLGFSPLGGLALAGGLALGGGLLGSIADYHQGGTVTGGVNRSLAAAWREAGVRGYLDGGMVSRGLSGRYRASMADDVPALLQTGEAVLNRSAVRSIGGPSSVDAINSGASMNPNLNVNVGINPNAGGLGQAAAALLPFLIGSINVSSGASSQKVSQNLMGFRGVGGSPLIRQS